MSERSTSHTLEELVANAAAGDRAAQEELMRRYWPLIEAAVRGRRGRGRARADTQDLAQDAALHVLTHLDAHAWRGSSAFAAWVRTLAKHEALGAGRRDRARKRDVRAEVAPSQELPLPGRSMESVVDNRRQAGALLAELEHLPADQRAALLLHHAGFSHAEVGDILACSAEAARKLVSRGKVRLLTRRGET